MKELILVGVGGCLGSILRFKTGVFFLKDSSATIWANGTLTVNLMGCLLIGLLYGMNEKFHSPGYDLRLLLITGFLGGFTTFSAFGLETVMLVREGQIALALQYVLTSVVGGIVGVSLGFWFGSAVLR